MPRSTGVGSPSVSINRSVRTMAKLRNTSSRILPNNRVTPNRCRVRLIGPEDSLSQPKARCFSAMKPSLPKSGMLATQSTSDVSRMPPIRAALSAVERPSMGITTGVTMKTGNTLKNSTKPRRYLQLVRVFIDLFQHHRQDK